MIVALALLVVAAPIAIVDVAVEVGDGTRLDRATVVIDGAVITGVFAAGGVVGVPDNASRIDGVGKVLSPGLFAVSSQLGLFEVGLEAQSDDDHLQGPATPGFRAVDGYNPLSPHIAIDREEGVTSALLAPSGTKLLMGQGFVVELSSRLEALPDGDKPAAMMGAFDGQAAEAFGGSRAGLLMALREIVDDARFYRKNTAAFDRGDARDLRLTPVHLRALQPVLDGKVPLVVRVDRAADIRALLAFAQKEKLKLVVDSGVEAWLVAAELKAANVPVIVRPSQSGGISLDALHARDDLAAVLHAAGVTVLISSWDSQNGTTRLRQEAGLAVQNGLPHAVAVRAITQAPQLVFGGAPSANVGVVKKGARASLVLWSGDPLEALTLAERVWVAGDEITVPSRQRLLAEKYFRARPSRPTTPAPTTR